MDNFLFSMHNIIKDGDTYKIEPAYVKDENGKPAAVKAIDIDSYINLCENCIYHIESYEHDSCELYNKLLNLPNNQEAFANKICYCEARKTLDKLTIIKSKDQMIEFIKESFNFFDSIESYESYYGFSCNYDESTGELTETVDEYYNRGGKFTKIPTQYPSVVYFDTYKSELLYIYIGKGDYIND